MPLPITSFSLSPRPWRAILRLTGKKEIPIPNARD